MGIYGHRDPTLERIENKKVNDPFKEYCRNVHLLVVKVSNLWRQVCGLPCECQVTGVGQLLCHFKEQVFVAFPFIRVLAARWQIARET